MTCEIKRLGVADYDDYRQLRIEGLELQEREFRYSPQDELALSKDLVIDRLKFYFFVGSYDAGTLIGMGGLTRFTGSKTSHRALLWGMYVRPQYRGRGAANKIMNALIQHAKDIGMEQIILTVVSENIAAIHFYKKWGFLPYGIDPLAIKIKDNDYLDEMLMIQFINNS